MLLIFILSYYDGVIDDFWREGDPLGGGLAHRGGLVFFFILFRSRGMMILLFHVIKMQSDKVMSFSSFIV